MHGFLEIAGLHCPEAALEIHLQPFHSGRSPESCCSAVIGGIARSINTRQDQA